MQFPGLVGVRARFGRQEPNDWGLARAARREASALTGAQLAANLWALRPERHVLWVDRMRVALACLTDLAFGDWAADAGRVYPIQSFRNSSKAVQRVRLVDADEMAGAGDDRELRVGMCCQMVRDRAEVSLVVLTDDDERRDRQ